jgi:hypothetical protein
MVFAVNRLPAQSRILQRYKLSSLALKTNPSDSFITQNAHIDGPSTFRPQLVFPKGKRGTFQAYLRAQQRRHEDREIWVRLMLLGRYGPYYEHAGPSDTNVDIEYWRSVASAPNIYEALQRLTADEHLTFNNHPLFPFAESIYTPQQNFTNPGPPTWLTMHLIANKVLTSLHARLALDLALNQLRIVPKTYRFPLVLLAVHRLLKFTQGEYLLEHFETILGVYSSTPEFHYNELLAVCGRLPKDDTSRQLILKLIGKMKEHSVYIDKHVAANLGVQAAAYPDIAALLPPAHTASSAWGHKFKPRYHIPSNLTGVTRRQRTTRVSKMSMADAIQALTPGEQGPGSKLSRLDAHEWSALVSSVGRDPNIGTEALRAFWDRVQSFRGKDMDVASKTAIMDAFRQRGQYEDALIIWKSIFQTPGAIDKRALTAAVMSLCGAAQYKEAFDTMDAFVFKNHLPSKDDATWPESRARWIEHRGRIQLDVPLINGLMDRLNRGGRPDVVFKLWDIMEKYYGVWPDGITMTILLDAARRAYLIDPTMELALGQLGIFNPFKRFWARQQLPETPSAAISKMLEKPPESGFWHEDWAFVNARVVFRDAVLGNWPHLQQISCPVGTYSPHSKADGLWVTKDRSPELRWPTIIPFDRTFHAYIFLLGWNELQAEIPLALAWMRALQIEPMYRTLCAALMYFGEVARLPPLFESFELRRGQEYGGDYGKLRRWIADWVGESNLPSENMIAAYRRGDGQQRMRWYGRKY